MDVLRVLGLQLSGISNATLVSCLERVYVGPRPKSGLKALTPCPAQLTNAANTSMSVIVEYSISGKVERLLPLFAIQA